MPKIMINARIDSELIAEVQKLLNVTNHTQMLWIVLQFVRQNFIEEKIQTLKVQSLNTVRQKKPARKTVVRQTDFVIQPDKNIVRQTEDTWFKF